MEALINYLLQFGHLNQQQIDLVKSKGTFKELNYYRLKADRFVID